MTKCNKETAKMMPTTEDSTASLLFKKNTSIRTRKVGSGPKMTTQTHPLRKAIPADQFSARRSSLAGEILTTRKKMEKRAARKADVRVKKSKRSKSRIVGSHTKNSDGTVTYHTKSKGKLQHAARIGHSLMHRHATKKARRGK